MAATLRVNADAERSALGCCLVDGTLTGQVLAVAPPHMFGLPKHEEIAAVLADLHRDSAPIDPQTVLARLIARSLAEKVGGGPYLHTLMERAWSPTHAEAYAEQVRDAYRFREVAESAERLTQRLEQPDAELHEVLALHQAELDAVTDLAAAAADQPSPNVDHLLAMPVAYDWLIPGLLERGDRLMLTGAEGLGKSMLLRQFAVCTAAGLNPFTSDRIDPLTVLVVDVENSRRQNRRRYDPIVSVARRAAASHGREFDPDRLRIEHRPDGLNLTSPADLTWLDRKVAANRPDVLVTGPLYKLHAANINEETAARQLVGALDMVRIRHNLTLVIEAHAGHGEDSSRTRKMRPAGSSLFMRWPEFGYGLRISADNPAEARVPMLVDMEPWRGARDERGWPTQLRRGAQGSMPWIANDPDDPRNFAPKWGAA